MCVQKILRSLTPKTLLLTVRDGSAWFEGQWGVGSMLQEVVGQTEESGSSYPDLVSVHVWAHVYMHTGTYTYTGHRCASVCMYATICVCMHV